MGLTCIIGMNQQPAPSHCTSRHIKIGCQWWLVVIQAYKILELIKGFIVVQWRLTSQGNKDLLFIYKTYERPNRFIGVS